MFEYSLPIGYITYFRPTIGFGTFLYVDCNKPPSLYKTLESMIGIPPEGFGRVTGSNKLWEGLGEWEIGNRLGRELLDHSLKEFTAIYIFCWFHNIASFSIRAH